MRAIALALVCASLMRPASASAQDQAWSRTFSEPIAGVSIASNDRCIAVSTPSRLLLLDVKGDVSWEAMLLEPATADARPAANAAVSPTCDWVAVQVSASHVQILRRDGFRALVGVSGPTAQIHDSRASLDIDPSGALLAIGGMSDVYDRKLSRENDLMLVDRTGTVVRRTSLGSFPDSTRATFTSDGQHLVISKPGDAGVMSVATLAWVTSFASANVSLQQLRASRDGKHLLGQWYPAHGPQCTFLYRFDERGRTLWTTELSDGQARISPDGAIVAVSGYALGCPYSGDDEDAEEKATHLTVRDSAGRTLRDLQLPAEVLTVTSRGCVVTGEPGEHARTRNRRLRDDLVTRDRALKEVARVKEVGDDYIPNVVTFGDDLWLFRRGNTLNALRAPDCTR